MTNLQIALNKRLTALKESEKNTDTQDSEKEKISTESIKISLRGAGILDAKDRVVQLVTVK